VSAPGVITTEVSWVRVEYAGCGSHALEVELDYAGEGGAATLAKKLRAEADRIDPMDPQAVIDPTFAEVRQDRLDLIEAGRAVVGYRNGHTEYLLAAAIDNLQSVMRRLGAYE
jgi:hypothetical protein